MHGLKPHPGCSCDTHILHTRHTPTTLAHCGVLCTTPMSTLVGSTQVRMAIGERHPDMQEEAREYARGEGEAVKAKQQKKQDAKRKRTAAQEGECRWLADGLSTQPQVHC